MGDDSRPEELQEHAKIFRRWADETDFPVMRQAFLSPCRRHHGSAITLSANPLRRDPFGGPVFAAQGVDVVGSPYLRRLEKSIRGIGKTVFARPQTFIRKGALIGTKGSRLEEER
jgi:hypothetical protein